MKKIPSLGFSYLAFSLFIYLFFFRPGIAMRVSGDFDDRAYLCGAQKWVGITSETCPQTSHFTGVAVTWFPALVLARIFALATSEPFEAWAGFWVGLTSFLCWVASLFLIDKIIQLYLKQWDDSPARTFLSSGHFPILFLMNIPVLYFATTRTFMVHTVEFFWALLFLYFLKRGRFLWGLVSLGVLLATRPINLGACFLFPAFLLESTTSIKISKKGLAAIFATILVAALFVLVKMVVTGYHETFVIPLILDFKIKSLWAFLFAQDFGLVWSQFVWLFAFLLWGRYFKRGSAVLAAAGFWMFVSGLTGLFWPTRGGTFGYRYLIGSYAAVLLAILETAPYWSSFFGSKSTKLLKILLVSGALWGSVQCWIYPAPKPYWPWDKPLHTQLGLPYGQVFSWIKQTPDLVKMNRFSQVGQFLERLGLVSQSEFTRQGAIRGYALEGSVGQFNFFLTGVLAIATLFRTVTQWIRRKI
ncbi:MAG: hypothetical protein EBR01_14170 [Proteobacteria bacterium]|nr:hypothetical protein [Pseudomonadota bacterium]